MKIRLLIGLLMLSCSLVSCNREVVSITTPAVSTSGSTTAAVTTTTTVTTTTVTTPDTPVTPPAPNNNQSNVGGKPLAQINLFYRMEQPNIVTCGETVTVEIAPFHCLDQWDDQESKMFCLRIIPDENVEIVSGNLIWIEDFTDSSWYPKYDPETYELAIWEKTIKLEIDTSLLKNESGEITLQLAYADLSDPFNSGTLYCKKEILYAQKNGYIYVGGIDRGDLLIDEFLAQQ